MSSAASAFRTQRVAVPAQVADTPEARKADYLTAVRLDGGPAATPEQWARGCLGDAPAPVRAGLVLGWTRVFRLRLGPRRSSATVLGWFVADSTDGAVTISAGSPLMEAQHHFVRDGDSIVWATVVRTHTTPGRLLWRAAAGMHELSMPLLMKHAARHIQAGRDRRHVVVGGRMYPGAWVETFRTSRRGADDVRADARARRRGPRP